MRGNPYMLIIVRNNIRCYVSPENILATDLVLCSNGSYAPAYQIPALRSYFARLQSEQSNATQAGGWGIALFIAALACLAFVDFNDNPRTPRPRRRSRNDEPLTPYTRARVRERDQEICNYCGCNAPNGHVDHRRSRANGGTNHLNNLSWACSSCNCSKGARDARKFTRTLFAVR